MDFQHYKPAFEVAAANSGYSEENIKLCLDYAKVLLGNKVPVIYNTSHLSALVGYKKQYIKKAVVYTPSFYRDFTISKRNGKPRTISEPLPSLKEIQVYILENILHNIPVSPFAKAYRKDIGLLENLRFHKNQPLVFTIDLKDFFPSISTRSVEEIFLAVGYSKLISNLLAKLCTKNNALPQGSPTSPYISNIFFKPADDAIIKYCLANNIKYTRYADDLSFSGDFNKESLFNVVATSVSAIGLTINEEKTKIMKPNVRQIVTGIVVNKHPQVPFSKRNKLRQEMFFIKTFGLQNHIEHLQIKQSNYFAHLMGKINFVLQINPSDKEFQDYKMILIEEKKKMTG